MVVEGWGCDEIDVRVVSVVCSYCSYFFVGKGVKDEELNLKKRVRVCDGFEVQKFPSNIIFLEILPPLL